MPRPYIDLTGQAFGLLTAVERGKTKYGRSGWVCACECGKTTVVATHDLRSGHTKSCGCSRGFVHGLWGNPAYKSWHTMKQRCLNPNDPRYSDYGGRGIKVHESWMEFPAFLANMGERPDGTTLDRIDNNGDYTPDNCRWATSRQQADNKRPRRDAT